MKSSWSLIDRVKISKLSTRDGGKANVIDGHVVEGEQMEPAVLGLPYLVRITEGNAENEDQIFATSPVRVMVTDKKGLLILLTDNSRYSVESISNE